MNISVAVYNSERIMFTELAVKLYGSKCLLFVSNTFLLESITKEFCTIWCSYDSRSCYGKYLTLNI